MFCHDKFEATYNKLQINGKYTKIHKITYEEMKLTYLFLAGTPGLFLDFFDFCLFGLVWTCVLDHRIIQHHLSTS